MKKSLKNLVDWQSLGLELGLLYPTLKRIKKEQCGDINDCKMEMRKLLSEVLERMS